MTKDNSKITDKAYKELKDKLVGEMFDFINKYCAPGTDCIYPQPGYILIKVLSECLKEARTQMFTHTLRVDISINEWINIKLEAIAKKLPNLIYSPKAFECGYQTGYKASLLELESLIEGGAELKESNCWCRDKYHDAGEICL